LKNLSTASRLCEKKEARIFLRELFLRAPKDAEPADEERSDEDKGDKDEGARRNADGIPVCGLTVLSF
jgi:hypothetical protein